MVPSKSRWKLRNGTENWKIANQQSQSIKKLKSQDILRTITKNTITKICQCNVYPLLPHFYILKLGFTWLYLFFYPKQRLWVHTINVLNRNSDDIKSFQMKLSFFLYIAWLCFRNAHHVASSWVWHELSSIQREQLRSLRSVLPQLSGLCSQGGGFHLCPDNTFLIIALYISCELRFTMAL